MLHYGIEGSVLFQKFTQPLLLLLLTREQWKASFFPFSMLTVAAAFSRVSTIAVSRGSTGGGSSLTAAAAMAEFSAPRNTVANSCDVVVVGVVVHPSTYTRSIKASLGSSKGSGSSLNSISRPLNSGGWSLSATISSFRINSNS